MKTNIRKAGSINILLLAFVCCFFGVCCGIGLSQEIKPTVTAAADNSVKLFVVCYSRTEKARMVATALKNQLGCEMGEIVSHSKKGVFTIMLDQVFNRDDCQEPLSTNLKAYNPIIIVTPVWFMRLSSPARTFIKTADLKGKDAYIFTTSGGPMPESRKKAFGEFASEHGLNVKGVIGLQTGKKTQADFDKEVQEIVGKMPLKQGSAKQQ
jgi:hypothetical protein